MTMTLKECAVPDVRSGMPPHPLFCDPEHCQPDDSGDFHRSAGLTLKGQSGAAVTVCAARADCAEDWRRFGDMGAPIVELTVDLRNLWSDRWVLPDDDEPGMVGLDLDYKEALRLGVALMHLSEVERDGRRASSVSRIRTDGGDELTLHASRLGVTGQRFVGFTFTLNNVWSVDQLIPQDKRGGVLGLNLTAADAHRLGEAIHAAAYLARQADGVTADPTPEELCADDPPGFAIEYGVTWT